MHNRGIEATISFYKAHPSVLDERSRALYNGKYETYHVFRFPNSYIGFYLTADGQDNLFTQNINKHLQHFDPKKSVG